jgi:hypothetical protein
MVKVDAAAILIGSVCYSVPAPGRHHHIIHLLADKGFKTPIRGKQGFLLSSGDFATRKEAGRIAIAAGQITKLNWPPDLYSEDLW